MGFNVSFPTQDVQDLFFLGCKYFLTPPDLPTLSFCKANKVARIIWTFFLRA